MSDKQRNHAMWLLSRLSNVGGHEWKNEDERRRFFTLMDHFVPELMGLDEARQLLRDEIESLDVPLKGNKDE